MERARNVAARVGNVLLTLVLVGSLLVFGLIALGPHVFGYRTATMLTGSMEPGIKPGDVVVSAERPAADVRVGDVISYHIPVEDHRVETHRIVEVKHLPDGQIAVRTKGDNNDGNDPWLAVLEGDTVWEMQFTVPFVGQAIRALRTPFVQDYVFWGCLALCLLLGLGMIWRTEQGPGDDFAGALGNLADELDADYAAFFARQWSDMLPDRVARIRTSVDERDPDRALDAALSLKVSAATVGALNLSGSAEEIEQALRAEEWDVADGLVVALPGLADETGHDLAEHLDHLAA